MKKRITTRTSGLCKNALGLPAAVAIAMLALSEFDGPACAASLYWDTDGSTGGNNASTGANIGDSGIWSTADANWWNSGFGTLQAWTDGSDAVFWGTAGTVTASNVFKLFDANSYNGAFAALTPAVPRQGLAWNTNTLATDGTLRVVSTVPATITNAASGNLLILSWPADHIGWRLQAQTNSISAGLGTNWVDVPYSAAVNQMSFTLDPAAGSIFYRLIHL